MPDSDPEAASPSQTERHVILGFGDARDNTQQSPKSNQHNDFTLVYAQVYGICYMLYVYVYVYVYVYIYTDIDRYVYACVCK